MIKNSTPESLRRKCAHFFVIRFNSKRFCFDDISRFWHLFIHDRSHTCMVMTAREMRQNYLLNHIQMPGFFFSPQRFSFPLTSWFFWRFGNILCTAETLQQRTSHLEPISLTSFTTQDHTPCAEVIIHAVLSSEVHRLLRIIQRRHQQSYLLLYGSFIQEKCFVARVGSVGEGKEKAECALLVRQFLENI